MNNRGQSISFIIKLLIALGVLFLAYNLIFSGKKIGEDAVAASKPVALQGQVEACKFAGSTHQKGSFVDSENNGAGDGLPDYCDPCVGGNDAAAAEDGDYMATGCDKNPTETDTSGLVACCGKDVVTIDFQKLTFEQQKAKCPNLKSIQPYFRCQSSATP